MIRLIVAMDQMGGIAKQGYTPWSIPMDMAYFVTQTKSHGGKVLVGGITFRNSLKGKPLKGRTMYLLTKSDQAVDGVQIVHDLETWLKDQGTEDVWVIGGANVFSQVMAADLADELFITHIDADLHCDQFFPDYKEKFQLVSQSEPKEQNGFRFTFARYVRAKSTP